MKIADGEMTWAAVEGATAYAIVKDGAIVAIVPAPGYTVDSAEATWAVRAANSRGGFGEAVKAINPTGISAINAEEAVDVKYYNMQGIRVGADYRGVVVKVATTASGNVTTTKTMK